MKEEGSYPLFGTGIASHQASELGECGGSEGPGKPGPGRGYWEQQTLQGACACAEGRTWGCRALPGGRRRAEGPWEVPQLQRERERGGLGERRTGGAGSAGFPESEVLIPGLYLNLSPLISVF